ncbi:hypothetical protein KI387_030143, partial [Taxus chinensis]
ECVGILARCAMWCSCRASEPPQPMHPAPQTKSKPPRRWSDIGASQFMLGLMDTSYLGALRLLIIGTPRSRPSYPYRRQQTPHARHDKPLTRGGRI